ncbi:MAG: hypothetical protein ABI721_01095 [Candidatus Dojkabacteria bacterium]
MKSRKRFLILLLIIAFFIAGILFLGQNNPQFITNEQIKGPDAPVNQSVSAEDLNLNLDKSRVLMSQDGNSMLILKEIDERTSSLTTTTYSLTLNNSKGEILKVIEENNIINSNFIDNNFIAYQIIGDNAGIYRYDMLNNTKLLIQETSDTEAFKYFAFLNSDEYLRIQPRTGQVGLVKISIGADFPLGEKVIPTLGSYSSTSAYSWPAASPDSKYITLLDSAGENGTELIVTFTGNQNINKQYLNIPIGNFPSQLASNDAPISWSSDSKILILGYFGIAVNLEDKSIIYNAGSNTFGMKLSPDNTLLLVNKTEAPTIESFDNKQAYNLPPYISDFGWLSNKYAILVIGQNLYLYNISNSELTKVIEDIADFQIVHTDGNGNAVIKKDSTLLKVTTI